MRMIVFRHKGDVLLAIALNDTFEGEVQSTKELLAYEKNIDISEIDVTIENEYYKNKRRL